MATARTDPRPAPVGRGRQSGRQPPKPARGPRRNLFLLAALVVLAAGVTWAVVRAGGDRQDTGTGRGATDPGVAHVHGLGVDPADGSLHIATHFGTFRLDADGSAERVGGSYQDTMGFTVVAPGHYLGSGHPDAAGLQAGRPGLLGLIESTDGGRTWRTLSLSGEVDFHALAYAHNRVYGWDSTSGRFMVSTDRTTWDTRSTLQLFSFAVDPNDADHVLAATPGALVASTDGARTWETVFAAGLVAVAWDADSGLWGVTGAGEVHHSDDGRSWAPVGELPGEPQAFLADGDTLYAAAAAGDVTGIYGSTDGGATWQLLYRDDPD